MLQTLVELRVIGRTVAAAAGFESLNRCSHNGARRRSPNFKVGVTPLKLVPSLLIIV